MDSWHIKEPNLIFGEDNKCPDPKLGVASYGPYRTKEGRTDLSKIKVGVIGDRTTIDLIHRFIDKSTREGFDASEDRPLEWAALPPVTRESKWNVEVEVREDLHQDNITNKEKQNIIEGYQGQDGKRISAMSDLLVSKIRSIVDPEPEPDVIICGIPEVVNKHCGTNLSKEDIKIDRSFNIETGEDQENLNSFLKDAKSSEEVESTALDLRAATKARAMDEGVPIQFVSEKILNTLVKGGGDEHPSKKAWNLWSAIYYKAGAYPWKLPSNNDDTLFVGVNFYEEEKLPEKPLKTAMAQVFTPGGKTLVIKGLPVEEGEQNRSPKMGQEGIETIMEKVKETYSDNIGDSISRMVVHKTSKFDDDEIEAFESNLGDVQEYDLVSFKKHPDFKLFRKNEEQSVYRGTATHISDNEVLLYTTGRKPYYGIYDGFRVPRPLLVRRDAGDSSMRRICREVLQLTKVNYNNARFSQKYPFTIVFAKAAGKVFKEMDPETDPKAKYRFYM